MILMFTISLLASIIGAICGIGGGVIIKPVLDLFQVGSVSEISFLSGCTVLSMTCYSVTNLLLTKEQQISLQVGTPLALGAAIGGITGKQVFNTLKTLSGNQGTVGVIQSACLALITFALFFYTLNERRIQTRQIQGAAKAGGIGFLLGLMSSFLGIGGGPIDLVVLSYFYSMPTKMAAANSLYIILFSQTASLLLTLFTHSVPEIEGSQLLVMIVGGILGGVVGRKINRKIPTETVRKLFMSIMAVIIGISVFTCIRILAK